MPSAKPAISCLALLLAASVVTGCDARSTKAAATASPSATASTAIQISISHCGDNWKPAGAGEQNLVVHNADTRPGEVLLTDAKTGAVFSYLEPFAPGSTADMDVSLPAGDYKFRCAMEDEDVIDGPTVTITGPVSGTTTPGVVPVTQGELIGPTKQYEQYVTTQLPALDQLTATLVEDVRGDNLSQARSDWLPAHLQYERLGAAYGAFGDADRAINGTIEGLPGGVNDPDFVGFHRLEYGLWHGQSAVTLTPIANALMKAVQSLTSDFAKTQIEPADVSIRAHEITENAIEFELTGDVDFGSHSNLDTVAANLVGTRTVLDLLKPLLLTRYPDLGRVYTTLAKSQKAIPALTTLPELSRSQREDLNADLGELVELLAPIAEICEPRRTS